jgi:hypothetical protein
MRAQFVAGNHKQAARTLYASDQLVGRADTLLKFNDGLGR